MKNMRFARLLCGVLMAGLMVSCMGMEESDPSPLGTPEFKTFKVKDNGSLVFELSATVDKSAASRIAECGFYYGKDKNMSDAERIECKMTGGSFSADVTLREYGETFYACSYISNGSEGNEIWTDPKKIVVKDLGEYIDFSAPYVTSYDKQTKKMSVKSNYSLKEGVSVTECGFCYGSTSNISVEGDCVKDDNLTDGAAFADINEVAPGSSLYVRSYIRDGQTVAYGVPTQLHAYAVPSVEIGSVNDITAEGATVSACVSDDCGLSIISRGVVYVEGDNEPSVSTGKQVAQGTTGDFTVVLSGLKPNRVYSVRAYAENEMGVTYSDEKRIFKTLLSKVQVETEPATSIDVFSATLNAEIINNGGESITECGFYLSKNDGSAPDRFVCSRADTKFSYAFTNLEQATEYCFKAFAANSLGESVGEPLYFTTKATLEYALTLPDETYVYLSGIVVGETSRGFLLSDDNSNMLYVYAGNTWSESAVNVGDYVYVEGTMATYFDNRELTFGSVSVSGKESVPEMEANILTSDNVKDFIAADYPPCKICVEGQIVKDGYYYNILLGDGAVVSPNFPIVDMDQYVGENVTLTGYYLWTSTNSDGKNVVSFVLTDVLQKFEMSANCYVVSYYGRYTFPAVKGNSNESVGAVKSVEVLWESFGTSIAPKIGDLIKSVSYSGGYIIFQTSSTFREGNAVIAAKDASGTILWSWHIWMTDQPGECVYANNAGTMMDRNLGATSATPGDVGALGLLYQWGRKDPFLGSSSISSNVEAKSTITWPSSVSSSSSRGTNAYAIEHPTTFITYNDANYDWYYTGSSTTDNTRWQSEKTIYDPCPAGWRVPDGGSDGVWAKAGFDDQDYDDSDEGMLFGSGISSPATWYPAAGYRGYYGGSLSNVGSYGIYWSVTPNGYYAYGLDFYSYGYVYPTYSNSRAYGQSVRCLQE